MATHRRVLAAVVSLLLHLGCVTGQEGLDSLFGSGPRPGPQNQAPQGVAVESGTCPGPWVQYNKNYTATGVPVIQVIRQATGKQTTYGVFTLGLNHTSLSVANLPIQVHAHALPCSSRAGLHWLYNPKLTSTVEDNEIWFGMSLDASGAGARRITRDWAVGDNSSAVTASGTSPGQKPYPAAVIIHDPYTGLMALCCDLSWGGGIAPGSAPAPAPLSSSITPLLAPLPTTSNATVAPVVAPAPVTAPAPVAVALPIVQAPSSSGGSSSATNGNSLATPPASGLSTPPVSGAGAAARPVALLAVVGGVIWGGLLG